MTVRKGYLEVSVSERGGKEDARAPAADRRRRAGGRAPPPAHIADTAELFASYQYVELLAGQKQLAAKAFRAEPDAVRWLLAP